MVDVPHRFHAAPPGRDQRRRGGLRRSGRHRRGLDGRAASGSEGQGRAGARGGAVRARGRPTHIVACGQGGPGCAVGHGSDGVGSGKASRRLKLKRDLLEETSTAHLISKIKNHAERTRAVTVVARHYRFPGQRTQIEVSEGGTLNSC